MSEHLVLINGQWRKSNSSGSFNAVNPATKQILPDTYPISSWQDCESALNAAIKATKELQCTSKEKIANFLESYACRIEFRAKELTEVCHLETAYAVSPRLNEIELPRTCNQLRQAAIAVRNASWTQATIDISANIRSCYAQLGPVVIFEPNNFPLAFGCVSGGDFAAAIAAGNPVIAKAHPSHPSTARILAEEAKLTINELNIPENTIQLIYDTSNHDAAKLVGDPRVEAIAFTGSRQTGLTLKQTADKAGNLIYLELSSINPVIILPEALQDRPQQILEELCNSALMGSGQFCTNPGLVMLQANAITEQFIKDLIKHYDDNTPGTLLSENVQVSLSNNIRSLLQAGAELLTKSDEDNNRYCYPNTLLRISAEEFLKNHNVFQIEAFGNATLLVIIDNVDDTLHIIDKLEANLTGTIYTGRNCETDYKRIASTLRPKVGRLLNDKMPTGVTVSPAMQHGGRYPVTGHPGFTAVGIPAAIQRFAMLQCYDNVPEHRLPALLRNKNPNQLIWRFIDQQWTTSDIVEPSSK